MSWFRPLPRIIAVYLMLSTVTMLGACSFSPVYSGTMATQPLLNLAYDKPTSRLEQIIYQDLALRFGASEAATAPRATVSASSSSDEIGYSRTSNPNKAHRVTVNATLTVTWRDGTATTPIRITRQATAEYTANGQVLADKAAAGEAAERAAQAAAESLRLGLLAALNR